MLSCLFFSLQHKPTLKLEQVVNQSNAAGLLRAQLQSGGRPHLSTMNQSTRMEKCITGVPNTKRVKASM